MSTVADVQSRIAYLEQVIVALDTAFEAGDDQIDPFTGLVVSDSEYDLLRKELKDLAPTSFVFDSATAAADLNSGAKSFKHDPPMTSIEKAIGTLAQREAELAKWLGDVAKGLSYTDVESQIVQSYKWDGLAVAIYYENGKLVRAGLRPQRGAEAEDVTENIIYVEGVPVELWTHDDHGNKVSPLNINCCIRGEIICKKKTFAALNEEFAKKGMKVYANERNYAAGSIRQFKNPTITRDRKLSFCAYSIANYDAQPYTTEVERAKWCNKTLRIPFVQVRPYRHQDLKTLEEFSKNLDYEVDGIVLSVNKLEDGEQLGNHGDRATGNPRSKLAWKFTEQSAIVKVTGYPYAPGRTGRLTPVIQFNGVSLEGSTVSQCSGHSLGFMDGSSPSSLGEIGIGAEIEIIKSGKVIPKVIRIHKAGNKHVTPHNCPACHSTLIVEDGFEGAKHLLCPNEFCRERAVNTLCHYLKEVGIKGVAESAVTKLFQENLVSYYSDFYRLTVKQLTNNNLFSERQALLLIASVHMLADPTDYENADLYSKLKVLMVNKKNILASKLLAGLGVTGIGTSASEEVIFEFSKDGSDAKTVFNKLLMASVDDFQKLNNFGDVSAHRLHNFFQANAKLVTDLLEHVIPELPQQGKLSGLNFVFTGGFQGGKEAWQDKAAAQGAKIGGSVSKKTDYLVVGELTTDTKLNKAKSLGIKVLTPEELLKML